MMNACCLMRDERLVNRAPFLWLDGRAASLLRCGVRPDGELLRVGKSGKGKGPWSCRRLLKAPLAAPASTPQVGVYW